MEHFVSLAQINSYRKGGYDIKEHDHGSMKALAMIFNLNFGIFPLSKWPLVSEA